MSKERGFESKQEKYLFSGIVGLLVIVVGMAFYPAMVSQFIGNRDVVVGKSIELGPTKTAKEFYKLFQCSCCGQPIDANCCGMAKQRKEHLDKILLEGPEENEVFLKMVKKFGFDVLMDPLKEQEVRDYIESQGSDNPPKIEIKNPRYDFGTISQSDGVVSTTFTIENTGESDLIIDNMDSSCMCTSASLIYNGQEGPIFGMSMHGENPEDYSLAIPPGKTAQLKVYFDPMAHGKQKKPEIKVTREVTIISNDPVDFQKKVRIDITQVP